MTLAAHFQPHPSLVREMASPHASSFMCLPFGSDEEVRRAYTTYYGVCMGSAAVGTLGSVLFLFQVSCGVASKAISRTQKNILINLAVADFLADIGETMGSNNIRSYDSD